jgi:hypothetical protein
MQRCLVARHGTLRGNVGVPQNEHGRTPTFYGSVQLVFGDAPYYEFETLAHFQIAIHSEKEHPPPVPIEPFRFLMTKLWSIYGMYLKTY